MLIRHGESDSNVRDFVYAYGVHRKALPQEDADKRRAAEAVAKEPNGDTQLSKNGLQQALCLGEYWAPLLERAAEEGKLHIFVSPMRRTMQTIEPLVKNLHAKGFGAVRATCHRDLHEIPGVIHPNDRSFYMKYSQLKEAGEHELAQQARQKHAATGFTPAGLAPAEILSNFDWVGLGDALLSQDPERGWFTEGVETETQVAQRMVRLVDWLNGLRDQLPADHTVVLVGHGDQINSMLNELFARAFGSPSGAPKGVAMDLGPKSNTSVSCLQLDPGEPIDLQFFHRLDHLGPSTVPDTLMRGYRWIGLKRLQKEDPTGYYGLQPDGLPRPGL
jgi:broad specificity phosphatase PhoE